jgi:hypothetical protein
MIAAEPPPAGDPGEAALNDPATLPPNAVFSFGGGVVIVVILSF